MYKISAVFAILVLFVSCSDAGDHTQMNAVNGKWNKKTEQQFRFEIKDAQNPKNIIFVVRNNNTYPYSNLRMIVNLTNLKTKKKITDTLNCVLANPNGEWIGKGFGETKEILFQYRLNYKFPENAPYNIGITQAMRRDVLPGIEDIGVKIEPAKP
ncbi:gliding motility lipoprotein GldH [Chryseobacterium sp.]|uniref:gliding motility lipoprotein GldH n=1 Tax=Chryseobacterium sp. TaxID=1871047 RepID=UPI0011C78A0D|nr:gliding motility lipoprotein GldH [Chryseobacterium sp.]TXF75838.1 gliding motility lipoprotein GldH [Chryseobacterium sp.]